MKINIATKLNIDSLDNELNKCKLNNDEIPIMIMSPKTMSAVANSLHKTDIIRLGETNLIFETNTFGIYRGYKIFADPEMEYGEVDIR